MNTFGSVVPLNEMGILQCAPHTGRGACEAEQVAAVPDALGLGPRGSCPKRGPLGPSVPPTYQIV